MGERPIVTVKCACGKVLHQYGHDYTSGEPDRENYLVDPHECHLAHTIRPFSEYLEPVHGPTGGTATDG